MVVEAAFYRDTWAEINLDNIFDNVTAMKEYLPNGVRVCAVVKANGYGHGDVEVAQVALEAGADCLAVALLDEGLVLRKKGIQAPILVLGAVRPQDVAVAVEQEIDVTVFRNDWLREAIAYIPEGKQLSIHLKCDTGMARLGYREKENLKEAEEIVRANSVFALKGIYSHFATADEIDQVYYQKQLQAFKEMVEVLAEKPPLLHCSNSAATLTHQDAWYNAIRMGITMYGLSPSNEIKGILPFSLKEAFSLHTKMVHVKKIAKGESVSYGATYTADEDQWIATLPIGYADGWMRKLQGQSVLVDGIRMPIVGRVCMDQCMIKLPTFYPTGTEVTLIGSEKGEMISVDEIAAKLETINYEVTCMMGRRIPRVYKRHGKVISVRNDL